MKKKILFSLAAFVALFIITGCGDKKEEKKEENNSKQEVEKDTKESEKANMSETVILDKEGIKVTAKSIKYNGFAGPEIKLLIENNTDKKITIQTRNFSINGIMIDDIFSADVSEGKKVNDSITIFKEDLELANITTIKDIEFDIEVSDSNYDTILKQEGIKLTTDANDYVQKYNTDGKLILDQNDVKIYVLKKDETDSNWGSDIYVYIENNSSKNIIVQAEDVSIDGFMIEPAFSSGILSGKKIYDTITFFESDLKENDIKEIKEIDLKFRVFETSSWDDIFVTDTIKINF